MEQLRFAHVAQRWTMGIGGVGASARRIPKSRRAVVSKLSPCRRALGRGNRRRTGFIRRATQSCVQIRPEVLHLDQNLFFSNRRLTKFEGSAYIERQLSLLRHPIHHSDSKVGSNFAITLRLRLIPPRTLPRDPTPPPSPALIPHQNDGAVI